jgi:ribosomal protein S18 acetylase RimI-like enzyme
MQTRLLKALQTVLAKKKLSFNLEKEEDSNGFQFVAYDGDHKAGSVHVVLEYPDDNCYAFSPYEGEDFYDEICDNNMVVNIQHLEVKPEYRNQGIAQKMVEKALSEIKKEYSSIPVYINASPTGGIMSLTDLVNFYKKFGFKVLKTYPQHRNALLWKDKA